MESAGWHVVGYLVSLLLGGVIHWLSVRKNCEMCGMSTAKGDIRALWYIMKAIAEKDGITQSQLLEIETKARAMKE